MSFIEIKETIDTVSNDLEYISTLPQSFEAYKKVDVQVRPVPGVFPQEAMVHRQFPNNPLANLPVLPYHPPKFTPTEKITEERMTAMKLNPIGFL